jgi:hypothetical protein
MIIVGLLFIVRGRDKDVELGSLMEFVSSRVRCSTSFWVGFGEYSFCRGRRTGTEDSIKTLITNELTRASRIYMVYRLRIFANIDVL